MDSSIRNIDIELVKNDLLTYWGYPAQCVTEACGGTVGYTFNVDRRYFFKLYDTNFVVTANCIAGLNEQLAILDILRQNEFFADKICYPIKTRNGEYYYRHENLIGVLFNFIDGEAIGWGNPYTDDDLKQLANMVTHLHHLDPAPMLELCNKETFDIAFVAELETLLQQKTACLPKPFGKIVIQFSDVLSQASQQIRTLANELKNMNLPFVLCHTDIHGGNLMRNDTGKLFLVDWENVLLAPNEADLFHFSEQPYFPMFNVTANAKALTYYHIRRDLGDIWEFYNGLLNNEYSEDEQLEVFSHVQRILRHLEQTIHHETCHRKSIIL